ncbi:uncharacterized protein I303_107491 [Kwoniella dejecticola CBS 10117]|uniref:Inositol phospholipid biosynthesis protein Scs3 n=1 Tax=Kwoniella dejecticola CBS 10117 TaxID=1296121 RepID=A0A1A5ZZT9_9TREE|nr:uncharacterized protein I303_06896 [Kwoniella dejecticola CBS 10117]OBR83331.1 hypothetical protein I303_06896 [Kwoniella dejecticola CBS 10117]
MASPQPPSTPKSTRPTITTPHRRTNSASHASPIDFKPKSSAARRMSMTATSQSASLTPQTFWERATENEQLVLAGLVTSLMLCGILYSLVQSTSLDTSEIHHHSLPHRAAYFARKSNILNVVFVKRAWGWTSLLYLVHLFASSSSPSSIRSGPGGKARKLGIWILATVAWLLFTSWFFGAGLGDRIIALTGGNCAVPLPKDADLKAARDIFPTLFTAGESSRTVTQNQAGKIYVPLPHQFCSGTPLTVNTFPQLFSLIPAYANLKATSNHESLQALPRPRWHRGFDISGHAFLLTLSVMVLGRELAETWRSWAATSSRRRRVATNNDSTISLIRRWSSIVASGLVGIWCWMILMTGIYFHNPPEKLSGLVLGLSTAYLINVLIPPSSSPSPFNPILTPNAAFSRPSAALRSGGSFDENAARRGAVVDDGVIYEDPSESSGEDEAKKARSRNDVREKVE